MFEQFSNSIISKANLKCALINPPYHVPFIREGRCQSPQEIRECSIPQMTLAYVATVMENGGYEVRAWDCIADNIGLPGLIKGLREWAPDLVVLGPSTPTFSQDSKTFSAIRQEFPGAFMVAFGTHVTALPGESLLENPALDAVIAGEPEWVVLEMIKRMAGGHADLSGISGLIWRKDGKIVNNGPPVFHEDLDSLGVPAWQYFPINNYLHPLFKKPFLMVNTSRGCGQRCIFCVGHLFYGYKVRLRTAESVLDEIEENIKRYKVRHFWFYADDFTRSPEFVKELCRGILKRRLDITWWSNSRVDCLDRDMFRLMAESGCHLLSLGGETGNAQILKKSLKGTKLEQIIETVDILRTVGINSLVYFLIGLPGETRETVQDTVRFAIRANPDYVEFYPAIPYPGTDFYDIAVREGLIRVGDFDLYQCGGSESVVKVGDLTKEELDHVLKKAYRQFYFRPRYFLILLKRAARPSEFIRLISFGLAYFTRFYARKASSARQK